MSPRQDSQRSLPWACAALVDNNSGAQYIAPPHDALHDSEPLFEGYPPNHSEWLTEPRRSHGAIRIVTLVFLAMVVAILLPRARTTALCTSDLPRLGIACANASLLAMRNEASFWQIEALNSTAVIIRPRNALHFGNCPELGLARFDLRLHYANGESHFVRTPPRSTGVAGEYLYTTFPHPILVDEDMRGEVEAVLQVGFYPGAGSGTPCSGIVCNEHALESFGMRWSGQEVFTTSEGRASISARGRTSGGSLAQCTQFDPLPAVFLRNTTVLFTGSNGSQCSVQAAEHIIPITPDVVWFHLIGDSNMRMLVWHLAPYLALGSCTSYPPQKSPEFFVCHDQSGTGLVLTYQWWFLSADST